MKRSEFKQRHMRGGTPHHEDEAEMAARLAEEAGVQFDPEPPELPGRVEAEISPCDSPVLVPEGRSHAETTDEEDELIACEAARRYNAVGRILELKPMGSVLRMIFEEEGVAR